MPRPAREVQPAGALSRRLGLDPRSLHLTILCTLVIDPGSRISDSTIAPTRQQLQQAVTAPTQVARSVLNPGLADPSEFW
jgi:hypothetical protein